MWKKMLKNFNLSENYFSVILGFLVIVVLGFFVINIFKQQPGSQNGGETSSASTTEEQTEEKQVNSYTVQKGENLWQIAEKVYQSGYNWIDLAKGNNIANPNHIEEGQTLTVPEVTPILPETGMSESGAVETSSTPETYTVGNGESLWEIAVKVYNNGYKWLEIAKLNGLQNPDVIHAGNVLNLPR